MLLIDLGNSALKCREMKSRGSRDSKFQSGSGMREFEAFVSELQATSCYLASVASAESTRRVIGVLQAAEGVSSVHELRVLPSLGAVRNAYDDYRQLGVDRWLTLLAANALGESDVLIVDAGSAITIDLLTSGGEHLGGAILPGLNTSRQRFMQLFPQINFSDRGLWSARLPGRSTAECIRMDGFENDRLPGQLVAEWSDRLLTSPRILLCGQDAQAVRERLDGRGEIIPDLVFRGMLQQIHLQG